MRRWNGIPPRPEEDGWHWLREKRYGKLSPMHWTYDQGGIWYHGGEHNLATIAQDYDYVAPCPVPLCKGRDV